jgi:hypothetical protein
VPSGGGAYILSWIIHDWDDDRAITILENCRRAMAAGRGSVSATSITLEREPGDVAEIPGFSVQRDASWTSAQPGSGPTNDDVIAGREVSHAHRT